jgi:hypothetical protein
MVGDINSTKFKRWLAADAIRYLQDMPVWWRHVLNEQYETPSGEKRPLLIALRDGKLDAYAGGHRVLRIGFKKTEVGVVPRCKLHWKFAEKSEAKGADVPVEPDEIIENLQKWIKTALSHAPNKEKHGVAAIVHRHANVIDVEMALPRDNTIQTCDSTGAPRMDIVALEGGASVSRINLAFYEAKCFDNPSLRANDLRPEVFCQLKKYELYMADGERQKQVLRGYQSTCKILRAISRMRGTQPHRLVEAVADGAALNLDPRPRLIVFEYDARRADVGSYWTRHWNALRENYCVIMSPQAKDITLRSCRESC